MDWRVGDVAGYLYGGPGPDVTYLLIRRIEGDLAEAWDLDFKRMRQVKLQDLWHPKRKVSDLLRR